MCPSSLISGFSRCIFLQHALTPKKTNHDNAILLFSTNLFGANDGNLTKKYFVGTYSSMDTNKRFVCSTAAILEKS